MSVICRLFSLWLYFASLWFWVPYTVTAFLLKAHVSFLCTVVRQLCTLIPTFGYDITSLSWPYTTVCNSDCQQCPAAATANLAQAAAGVRSCHSVRSGSSACATSEHFSSNPSSASDFTIHEYAASRPPSPFGNSTSTSTHQQPHGCSGLSEEDEQYLKQYGLSKCCPVQLLGSGVAGLVEKVQIYLPSGKVKQFARKTMSEQSNTQHLRNEAAILKNCSDCPFIPTIYASDSNSILMELAPHGNLFKLLQALDSHRHQQLGHEGVPLMSEHHLRYYAACVVSALHFLHTQLGAAHRDIKPENIVLCPGGIPKLLDMDATVLIGTDKIVSALPVGTPGYISPEALQGELYSVKTDIWSLGIMLLEIAAEPDPEHLDAILFQDAPYPPWMSEELCDLLDHLLVPETFRYDTAQIMRHAFFKDVNWEQLHQQAPPLDVARVRAMQQQPAASGLVSWLPSSTVSFIGRVCPWVQLVA